MRDRLAHRALIWALDRLDAPLRRRATAPSPRSDATRHPGCAWDLRTLIALFPRPDRRHFLNLNTVLGSTGACFDRAPPDGLAPSEVFDLQFCLEDGDDTLSHKRGYAIGDEVRSVPGSLSIDLPGRLRFVGSWPRYDVRFEQPEDAFALELRLEAWRGTHIWARLPGLYSHYTSFGTLRGRWSRGEERGSFELPALHDHGWGRNSHVLRDPLSSFRYEVLELPPGGYAIALDARGPLDAPLRRSAALRWDRTHGVTMDRVHHCVDAWETFENYLGTPCRVPHAWSSRLRGPAGELAYRAERVTTPRPIVGDGFLYGFEYRGTWSPSSRRTSSAHAWAGLFAEAPTGPERVEIEGRGYAEQMGRAWALGRVSESSSGWRGLAGR